MLTIRPPAWAPSTCWPPGSRPIASATSWWRAWPRSSSCAPSWATRSTWTSSGPARTWRRRRRCWHAGLPTYARGAGVHATCRPMRTASGPRPGCDAQPVRRRRVADRATLKPTMPQEQASHHRRWQFWIDRGGTFTDVVGRARTARWSPTSCCRTTPSSTGDAAVAGIRHLPGLQAGQPITPDLVECVKMGTTVATNALLERKGEPTLLVTQGFRDARCALPTRTGRACSTGTSSCRNCCTGK